MRVIRLVEVFAWGALALWMAHNQSTIIVWALTSVYGTPTNAPAALLRNLSFASPIFPLILAILAVIRIQFGKGKIAGLIGFSLHSIGKDLGLGLCVGAISIAITIVSLRIMSSYAPLPPYAAMPMEFHLFFATIGAVIPGICEEFYFRGLMMSIGRVWPGWLMVLLSAGFFSAWHIGSPIYLVHTFLLGALWAILFIRTGRLMPSVIAHISANAGFGLILLAGVPIFS